MPGRTYADDPSIADDEGLLRRVPPSWVHWDEEGNPTVSSAAFKQEDLSVYIESVMVRDHRLPSDAVGSYPGYGLVTFTAAHARSLNQAVARDPLPDEPAHGVVFGQKKRARVCNKLRDGATWVVTPLKF